MTINELVYRANLQPGDAIVVNKNWGFLDHYVIYLGRDQRGHIFVANMMITGVKRLTRKDMIKLLPKFTLNRVRYFNGNRWERRIAVQRAINLIGRQGYDLFSANCEHFANYVQKGVAYSKQSQIAKQAGLALGGLALIGLILSSGNEEEEEDYR